MDEMRLESALALSNKFFGLPIFTHQSLHNPEVRRGLTRAGRPNDDLPPLRQQQSINLLYNSPTVRMLLITPPHLDQDLFHPLILQDLFLRMQRSPTRWFLPHLAILHHDPDGYKVLHTE